jgi:hypothetical protein
MGAMILGPRLGKYGLDKIPRHPRPQHSARGAGVFIPLLGWSASTGST